MRHSWADRWVSDRPPLGLPGRPAGRPSLENQRPCRSAFYGIAIFMYWDDHDPAHYHAIHAQHEALIVLADRSVLRGSLPPRALRLVRTWHRMHQEELEAAWEQAKASYPPATIDPLP